MDTKLIENIQQLIISSYLNQAREYGAFVRQHPEIKEKIFSCLFSDEVDDKPSTMFCVITDKKLVSKLQSPSVWYVYQILLLSEFHVMGIGSQLSHETAYTGELIGAIQLTAAHIKQEFDIDEQEAITLKSIDLQRGNDESVIGGDFLLISEIVIGKTRKYIPLIVQAKRVTSDQVKIDQKNSNGYQIETLKSNNATSLLLYYTEYYGTENDPRPPLVKETRFIAGLNDSDVLSNSCPLSAYLVGTINCLTQTNMYDSEEDAVSSVKKEINIDRLRTLFVLTERKSEELNYINIIRPELSETLTNEKRDNKLVKNTGATSSLKKRK